MALRHSRIAAVTVSALLFVGCSSNEPPQLQEMQGSSMPPQATMQEQDLAGRTALVWRAPDFNPRQYTQFIIEPVQIYSGSDANFSGASPEDKQEIAQFMQTEFTRVLGEHYRIVTRPGPGVARVKLTLAGLQDNVPVVATVSRLAPAGLAINLVKSGAGQPGSFTGSVTIAGEIVDAATSKTLISFIQKRSPDAMNIGATLSSRDAQHAAITQAAEAFRNRVDAIQQGKA